MPNIIYRHSGALPWDTQSAFKMKYYTGSENKNTVFCYLKGYQRGDDLSFCVYFFEAEPTQRDKLCLYLNLTPLRPEKTVGINFGYRGINRVFTVQDSKEKTDCTLKFNSYQANDEQGYYWCAEIEVPKAVAKELFGEYALSEKFFSLNLVREFDGGHFGSLSTVNSTEGVGPRQNMEIFTIIDY